MTELNWGNELDKLQTIKHFIKPYQGSSGYYITKYITIGEIDAIFNKYLPWVIKKLEQLDNETK